MTKSIGYISIFLFFYLLGACTIITLERFDKIPAMCSITPEAYEFVEKNSK